MRTINRTLFVGLLLLLSSPSGFSQQSRAPSVESNLYYRAIVASLDKMAESWGSFDESMDEDRIRTDYRNMIVEKNEITKTLPSQVGDHRVEYLDAQELIERYKKLRKEFAILVTHPMENDGERLKISFTVHWISYRKRTLSYAISDWSNVYFHYDCAKREYVIDEVKLGGI